jgi:hypothetical protein
MNFGNWEVHAICKNCGWHEELSFADYFHMHYQCCPKCGQDTPRHGNNLSNWMMKKVRWAFFPSKIRWYDIRTWFSGIGHWQVLRDDGKVELLTNIAKEK